MNIVYMNFNEGIRINHRNRIAKVCRVLGILLIAIYAGVRIHGPVMNYASSQALANIPATLASDEAVPDFSLWDSKRIEAYKQALLKKFDPPAAVLIIEKIGVRVAVFDGTDEFILNRGVGRIRGTARIGGTGNTGIAGHRDGFFRGLKDVAFGDEIQLITHSSKYIYKVNQILIVDPQDVHVLKPGATPSITLVTCYPFYFIGNAPQRYIIQASLQESLTNLH